MFTDPNIRATLEADGTLLASIDMPNRSMNVFSSEMMDSLEKLITEIEQNTSIKAVIITSAKASFVAGADLSMVKKFTETAQMASDEELHDLCGRLGRLFLRLEQLSKPTVAALNGLALGGGLELALACHQRVVVDDDRAVLGLPEIKLGLLPGAGGTQRLPRLIDKQVALHMLLTGHPLSPKKALEIGLVDAVANDSNLLQVARRLAHSPIRSCAPWNSKDFHGTDNTPAPDNEEQYRSTYEGLGIDEYTYTHYPAYDAIMDCVSKGLPLPIDAGSSWEMDVFVQLIKDKVAANMVRTLFLDRQRAGKQVAGADIDVSGVAFLDNQSHPVLKRQLEKAGFEVVSKNQVKGNETVITFGGTSTEKQIGLKLLTHRPATIGNGEVGIWLSEKSAHGQSMEIFSCGEPVDNRSLHAAMFIAKKIGAAPVFTNGEQPLMPALAETLQDSTQDDNSLAKAAHQVDAYVKQNPQVERDFVDVCCVLSGLFPAWTGGPFKYLANNN